MAGSILDQVPRRGEVTQAPQSSVGPDTIATPWKAIAGIFGTVGDQLSDRAAADATVRGQNAVTRKPDGTLGMSLMANNTQAGVNYNRAVMSSYLARLSGDIRTAAQDQAIKANGDTEAFKTSWGAFSDKILASVAPEVRGPVADTLADIGGTQDRGIVSDRYTSDIQEAQQTISAQRDRLASELSTMAINGQSGSPEFTRAMADYRDLGTELADNPAFTVSREAQTWSDDHFQSQLVVATVTGDVSRRFATSPNEARDYAEQVLNDPTLNLDADERQQAVNAVMAQFSSSTSAYRIGISANTTATQPVLDALKNTNTPYDPGEVADAIATSFAVGDIPRAIQLQQAVRLRDSLASFDALPADQQAAAYSTQYGVASGSTVDRIIAIESGGDPAAASDSSNAVGLGQFIPATWLDMVRQYRPDVADGKSDDQILALRTDPDLSREMVGHYVEENAAFLTAHGQQPTDGNIYLAHFLGPAGAVALLGAQPWALASSVIGADAVAANPTILRGKTVQEVEAWAAGKMGQRGTGAVDPDLLTAERSHMTDDLGVMLDHADAVLDTGHGVDAAGAQTMVNFARAVDDPATTARVADIITRAQSTDLVNGLTPGQAEDLTAQLTSGVAGDAYVTTVIQDQADRVTARRADLAANNPYLLGVDRGLYQPTTLDTSTPATLETTLRQHFDAVKILEDQDHRQYQNILQPEEAASLTRAYTAATPDGRVQMAAAIVHAIPDGQTLTSTLGQIAGADQGTTLAVAGALYQNNPDAARGVVMGEDILKNEPDRAPPMNDTGGNAGWNTLAATALPPETFGTNPGMLAARSGLLDSARLLYVSLAYEAGMKPTDPVNSELVQQAIDGVTGGMVDFNGQPVIAPVYGMSQTQFNQLLYGRTTPGSITPTAAGVVINAGSSTVLPARAAALMEGASTAAGLPIGWTDVLGRPDVHLESFQDGQYHIRFGDGPDASYAIDSRTGQAFTLNLGRAVLPPWISGAYDAQANRPPPSPQTALRPPAPTVAAAAPADQVTGAPPIIPAPPGNGVAAPVGDVTHRNLGLVTPPPGNGVGAGPVPVTATPLPDISPPPAGNGVPVPVVPVNRRNLGRPDQSTPGNGLPAGQKPVSVQNLPLPPGYAGGAAINDRATAAARGTSIIDAGQYVGADGAAHDVGEQPDIFATAQARQAGTIDDGQYVGQDGQAHNVVPLSEDGEPTPTQIRAALAADGPAEPVAPASPEFQHAQQVLAASDTMLRDIDSLTAENFYAMMVVTGLSRNDLVLRLARTWNIPAIRVGIAVSEARDAGSV